MRIFGRLAVLACLSVSAPVVRAVDAPARPYEGFAKTVYSHTDYDLHADRTYVTNVEWAYKVLTEQAVEGANSTSVSYSQQLQSAEIGAAYTLKADGRRIDAPPANFQEQSSTGHGDAAPMFSDLKTLTVVFPDVGVGDTIVFSYRLVQKESMFPGQFSMTQSFSKFVVSEDDRVTVSADPAIDLKVFSREVEGGEVPGTDGRRHWAWHYRNLSLARPEPGALSSFDDGPLIAASTFNSYGEIAAAYDARAESKAAVTPRIHELAEQLAKDAATPREQVKAFYDWVSKNVKFAGNCVGTGSVVPHEADLVLANRLGDCKDHTALMQALMADRGIASTPVLINSGSLYRLPQVPVIEAFNHVINYVPSLDLYLDATAEGTPFGTLPASEGGKPVLHTAGFDRVRNTPAYDARGNRTSIRTTVIFDVEGTASGNAEVEVRGEAAASVRDRLAYIQPQSEDASMRRMISSNGFTGRGTFARPAADDETAKADRYHYGVHYELTDALDLPGPGALAFRSPVGSFMPVGSLRAIAAEASRTSDFICRGDGAVHEELIMQLPASLRVLALPKDRDLHAGFAHYRAHYQRRGETVTVSRDYEDLQPGPICTPQDLEAFKPFAAAVAKDLRAQLVFR